MASGFVAFSLQLGPLPPGEVVVRQIAGSEAISAPFRFRVDFTTASGRPVELPHVVGQPALLRIARKEGAARLVHGEALRVELVEVAAGTPRYRAGIAPRLARLEHVVRSRVHQGRSAPEIARAVLEEHAVRVRSDLSGPYPAPEYVVQHRESDLAFVSRLLEEEGIWYRFEHAAGGHTMVLGDAPGAWADAGIDLPVRGRTGQGDGEEYVHRIARERRLVTGRVCRRDHDFRRPRLDLTVNATAEPDLEVYEWPGGYLDLAEGERGAQARLEELRSACEVWSAHGNAVAVQPGARVSVENTGELAVVRVEHRGAQEGAAGATNEAGGTYENSFVAVGAERPYRPPRRFARPRIAGVVTATVVGPGGEEIETEGHGRVRIQFHWDREGKRDDSASCWIRLAQAWAGAGMGASFVPRVGQEVVVRFLEGDPDRPLVCGAVYNGVNAPPLELPSEKSRSTLRTATTPGAAGSNELRLEDAQGAEEIWLHAQRDEAIAALRDRGREVKRHERIAVGGDRTRRITGNQALEVALVDAARIGGDEALSVARDRETSVAGAHTEAVTGAQAVTVALNRSVEVLGPSAVLVGGAAALQVGGAYLVSVAGVHNQAVGGLKTTEVGGAAVEWIGAARHETVGGDRSSSVGGDLRVEVDGALTSTAARDASAEVDGAEAIEVNETLTMVARELELSGADGLSVVVGGRVALSMGASGEVALAGSAVAVEGSEARLQAARLAKIAPGTVPTARPEVAALAPNPDPRATVTFTLADAEGRPVVNEPFTVELPDGTVRRGRTDGNGRAAVPGTKAGTARVTLTRLDRRAVEER